MHSYPTPPLPFLLAARPRPAPPPCHPRSRRRQSQRRRLASRLQPLTLEREWLLGVLPPSVTHAVLARLDPASLKALRAASRRTRMCVSSHTRRLDLDPRGVRRFSTAPLHVLFPGLRELHLHLRPTSAGPVSRTVGVGDAGGTGAGGGAGVRQLLALAESGALASLPRLQVLGVDAGFGQPGGGGGCRFSRQQWKAFVAALPGPAIHGSGSGPQGASPGMRLGAGAGPGGALRVRLDVRCLPARSLWTPLPQHAAPEWQDALWAVKWMARQRPQVGSVSVHDTSACTTITGRHDGSPARSPSRPCSPLTALPAHSHLTCGAMPCQDAGAEVNLQLSPAPGPKPPVPKSVFVVSHAALQQL